MVGLYSVVCSKSLVVSVCSSITVQVNMNFAISDRVMMHKDHKKTLLEQRDDFYN